jgi:lambda family phage tail tape measure protein
MSNSLASFATTGKGNFKGLVTSILGDLAKMELRVAESKILQSILGAFMGGTVDNSAAGAGSVSAGLGDGQWSGFAKGDVFSGSPSLSAYSGQVVNSPTPFLFASGAGIMGEAGPEAIMPLKRGSDGKLGVVAQGGGGVQLSQTFVIDSNGQSSDNTSGAANDDAMRQFSQRMKDVAKQTIMEEQRQGGSLWRMQH